MQTAVPFLLFASRGLAICAVLAGLGAGLLAVLFADLICVDSCGPRVLVLDALSLGTTLQNLTPCVVLEALALVSFVAYCLATRQAWRAVLSILFLVVCGAVGIAVLSALIQQAATLPVGTGGFLYEAPAVAWATQRARALTLATGIWAGVPALIQWRR